MDGVLSGKASVATSQMWLLWPRCCPQRHLLWSLPKRWLPKGLWLSSSAVNPRLAVVVCVAAAAFMGEPLSC